MKGSKLFTFGLGAIGGYVVGKYGKAIMLTAQDVMENKIARDISNFNRDMNNGVSEEDFVDLFDKSTNYATVNVPTENSVKSPISINIETPNTEVEKKEENEITVKLEKKEENSETVSKKADTSKLVERRKKVLEKNNEKREVEKKNTEDKVKRVSKSKKETKPKVENKVEKEKKPEKEDKE